MNKLLDRADYIIHPDKYWELRGKTYFDQEKHLLENNKRREFIVDEIVKLNPISILEIGCGYGANLKPLKARLPDSHIVGVDISSTQLANAKEYIGNDSVELHHLDASEGLPFTDEYFDLVFTAGVLMHVPHRKVNKIRNEMIRLSSTYILHDESTKAGQYIEFTYDHEAYYRKLGFEILKSITYNVPSEMKFVLVSKG
jgi:ubiquinone/menaquinone biosynthesis C-methylase UbiE